MTPFEFYEKGADLLRDASAKDAGAEYEAALALYKRGLTYLLTGLKYDKNEKVKAVVRAKIGAYMTRAETIAAAVGAGVRAEAGSSSAAPAAAGGGSGDSAASRAAKASQAAFSEEAAALRAQLEDVVLCEKPDLTWDDVAGLAQAKQAIEEAIVMPRRFPTLFAGKHRRPPKAILLYGPPGTGKTHLAKATAAQCDATFLSCSSADLISKWQGQSEKLVRGLFEMAIEQAPSVIFIDEVDSLAGRRKDDERDSTRRIKNEFLIWMQNIKHEDVLVLAATNRPMDIDPAARRRFDKRIYIPLPDQEVREVLFRIHIGKEATSLTAEDIVHLAESSEGYSGSDVSTVVRSALMEPVRKAMAATHFRTFVDADGNERVAPCKPGEAGAVEMSLFELPDPMALDVGAVTMDDFEAAMRDIRPSVNAADLADIDEFTNRFGTRTVAGRAVGAGVTSGEAAAVADIADGTDEADNGGLYLYSDDSDDGFIYIDGNSRGGDGDGEGTASSDSDSVEDGAAEASVADDQAEKKSKHKKKKKKDKKGKARDNDRGPSMAT